MPCLARRRRYLVENVPEVREHDYAKAVVLGFLYDLDEAQHLLGLGALGHGCLAHGHEVPGGNGIAVGGRVLSRHGQPFIDLDEFRKLGEHVLLVAAQIRRRHLTTKAPGGEFVHLDGEVGPYVANEVAELVDAILQRSAG